MHGLDAGVALGLGVDLFDLLHDLGLIDLQALDPEAFDMPLGFSTGGGVIFGATQSTSALPQASSLAGSVGAGAGAGTATWVRVGARRR